MSTGPRILVVRLGAMGDVIHALPAAAALKHRIPGARVTWAIEPKWVELLDGNPYVDRVVQVRRGSATDLAATWRALRAERYDLAIDFQGLYKSALVAAAAGAAQIHGFRETRERGAALFYTRRVEPRSVHVVDRNLELAGGGTAEFSIPPGRDEGELSAGGRPGGLPHGFILASPLAGWGAKQWPMENYRRLAQRLRDELGIAMVLNGPPGVNLGETGAALVHRSGLAGLIDASRRAAAVVGVDSGPLHLAAALGKPGVAIFGPTDPERNGPYGGSMRVLRVAHAETTYKRYAEIDRSMAEVTADQVFEALRSQLPAGCLRA